MEKGHFQFRVDTPSLLNEIFDNAIPKSMGVLKIPINIFRDLLVKVSQRAIELDDAELNILMLRLNLYEVDPKRISEQIELQKQRLENENRT